MARQQTYNFPETLRGDTWDGLTMRLLVNGTPKDITDAAVTMWLIKQPNRIPVKVFSTESGEIVISDAANGVITFAPWTEVNIEPDTYSFDIQYTFADGRKKTYIKGKWPIVNDISK